MVKSKTPKFSTSPNEVLTTKIFSVLLAKGACIYPTGMTRYAKYLLFVLIFGLGTSASRAADFYYKGTGAISNVLNWSSNPDPSGIGLPPVLFTILGATYHIQNTTSVTLDASLYIGSLFGSNLIVGDGVNPTNFIIPNGLTISGSSIDVMNAGTLTISNATLPSLGTLDAGSTVVFNAVANQAVPAASYGNLTVSGGTTNTVGGNLSVANTLTVTTALNLGTSVLSTMNTNAGTGTISTQNTGTTPIPSGKTWASALVYYATSGTQNVVTGSYNKLTMSGSSTKKFAAGTINVSGAWSSAGGKIDLTTNAVALNFTGSSAQTITDAGSNSGVGVTFKTVGFSGGGAKTLVTGPFSLSSTGVLTMGSATSLAANGVLTLNSDASSSASIAAIPSGSSITGNVTVQRYFSANRTWRLLSTPVSSTNFAELGTYILITGTGGSTNGFAQPAGYTANGPSILTYNTITKKFSSPGSISSNLGAGTGFYIYYRGDNSHNIVNKVIRNTSGKFATPEATVASQTGTINQQGLNLNLTLGVDGYNLIGNPYPSSITMPSGGVNATVMPGTTGFVYTYSPGASAISAEPGSVTIGSGQGFYVKAINGVSSAKVNFTESLKTTSQPGALLMGIPVTNPLPLIKLKLEQDSTHYDITYLRFGDIYKKAYNQFEDADDLSGSGQTVFFGAMTADAHLVAIASQPLEKQRTSVFLSVDGSASGTFKLSKQTFTDFPDKYDLILIDHFKKDSVSLLTTTDYSFDIDKNTAATFGNERFEVVVRPRILPPYRLLSFTGKKNTLNTVVNWTTSNEFTYTSFALERSFDGKTFEGVTNVESTGKGAYTFTDQISKPNIYYRLKSTDINDKVSYSSAILLMSLYGERIFSVYPNPNPGLLKFKLNQTVTSPVILNIYNLMGRLMVTKSFSANEGEQDVSAYTTGNYIVNLTDSSSGKLISSAKFIKQ